MLSPSRRLFARPGRTCSSSTWLRATASTAAATNLRAAASDISACAGMAPLR